MLIIKLSIQNQCFIARSRWNFQFERKIKSDFFRVDAQCSQDYLNSRFTTFQLRFAMYHIEYIQ